MNTNKNVQNDYNKQNNEELLLIQDNLKKYELKYNKIEQEFELLNTKQNKINETNIMLSETLEKRNFD